MQARGDIDLKLTPIIAISAITKNQFESSMHHELFDDFIEKPGQTSLLAAILEKRD